MVVITAIISFFSGILLSITAELVKRTSGKIVAAGKLYTSTILTLKGVLESSGNLSIAALSKKIYDKEGKIDLAKAEEKLAAALTATKEGLLKEKEKIYQEIKLDLGSKTKISKLRYEAVIIQEKYKKNELILSDHDIQFINPYMQVAVHELRENTLRLSLCVNALADQIESGSDNTEEIIDEVIELIRYQVKIYKDHTMLMNYARAITTKSFFSNLIRNL